MKNRTRNTKLNLLFMQVCVTVRDILRHPACSDLLRSVLSRSIADASNDVFADRVKAGDDAQTLEHLQWLTFGAQYELDEVDEFPLPTPVGEPLPLPVLFTTLAETITTIAAHPKASVSVHNGLCQLPVELLNECQPNFSDASQQILLRWALPAYLRLFAGLDYLSNT